MTIFLKIVKSFLDKEIKWIRNHSVEVDSSLLNSVCTIFGRGRDTDLSAAKRNLADGLLKKIDELEDLENDAKTLSELQRLIRECKICGSKESKKRGYKTEGEFGPAMVELITVLEGLYLTLQEKSLNDIKDDGDPFTQFQYHAAYYFFLKHIQMSNLGLLERIWLNPRISSSSQLTDEKEELVISTIENCKKALDTLDKEHQYYQQNRQERVLNFISYLIRGNANLCKSHGIQREIPLTQIKLPVLKPATGLLEDCMGRAFEEINAAEVFGEDEQKTISYQ